MRLLRILVLACALAVVVVPSAAALRFTDDDFNMPVGVVGQSYSKQFYGEAGCGPALPYQWRILDGTLPPGITFSTSGLFGGVPTTVGSWSFWVELSDQNPPTATWCVPKQSQREFTITVVANGATPPPPPPPPLKIVQSSLTPAATVLNQPYQFQLTASGGGSQSWKLQSGQLPAGVTITSAGLLSGTPTTTGAFSFDVQVSDGSRSDTHAYTLLVVAPLKIAPLAAMPAAEVGNPFQLQLTASGGKPGYAWSPAAGIALPPGLALDGATGALTGKPTLAGSFAIRLAVTDTLGLTDALGSTLVVAPKLATTNRSITSKLGRSVHVSLVAIGGVLPRSWTIIRGALPAGVRLGDGELVGKPRHVGTSTVLLQVRDALGAVARARMVLKVVP